MMHADLFPSAVRQRMTLRHGTLDGVPGWIVTVPHRASVLVYGPYPTERDAEAVAQRLACALEGQACTDA